MAAAGAEVEFLAMAMERLTALEVRVDVLDVVTALEARVAASEAALAAYKSAMPQPQAYYVVLEQPPWTAESRAAQLLDVRRSVLAAVASVTTHDLLAEMRVRCFFARRRGSFLSVVLVTCGSCGPTHDPGAMHTALSGCGLRVAQWLTIMNDIEQTLFEERVGDTIVHFPIRVDEDDIPSRAFVADVSTADADVGFRRVRENCVYGPDFPERAQRAEEWAQLTDFDFVVHYELRGDFDE